MKVEILGSGGAFRTPRPGCSCSVCTQARERGVPYARSGPGIFVHGPGVLIDTSEDIYMQLDRARLPAIRAGLYSHWHPDHTMGRRVWETLNADQRRLPTRHRRTDVYVPQGVLEDFRRFGLMGHFEFLAERWINLHAMDPWRPYDVNGYAIVAVPLAMERTYAFLIEGPLEVAVPGPARQTGRLFVAMDELHGWRPPEAVRGVDLAVLPAGIFDVDPFTGERNMAPEHPLLKEEATFDEVLACARALGAGKVVLSHIEEPDGLSYDALRRLEEREDVRALSITFAYDTRVIEVARGSAPALSGQ
ncbi:MBL fold metallo-hydrolase [Carboxydochorda subterranea]|uniref:MBL fold metallo-hydrolase n=1 Tax=Carboxydichorda subterranea TaxID=3109565 RepID=A0ABZ1BZJ6_9FIRM|nr:MBL fold metallo-hydrolase [Limnochorda sp. L945t]WRP18119.1 MBL fold metallo-hydrolase [Limnochorda sp. L945t]